jgi:hypothetical protein
MASGGVRAAETVPLDEYLRLCRVETRVRNSVVPRKTFDLQRQATLNAVADCIWKELSKKYGWVGYVHEIFELIPDNVARTLGPRDAMDVVRHITRHPERYPALLFDRYNHTYRVSARIPTKKAPAVYRPDDGDASAPFRMLAQADTGEKAREAYWAMWYEIEERHGAKVADRVVVELVKGVVSRIAKGVTNLQDVLAAYMDQDETGLLAHAWFK